MDKEEAVDLVEEEKKLAEEDVIDLEKLVSNRRKFLKTAGMVAGGIVLSQIVGAPAEAATLATPAWTNVTSGASGEVTFYWGAVASASGYKLYYGTVSGTYIGSLDLGNVTSKSFTGLSQGTYFVALAAYQSGGGFGGGSTTESGKSLELQVVLASGAPRPPVTIVSAVVGTTAYLIWSVADAATNYKMYYGSVSGVYAAVPVTLGYIHLRAFTNVPSGTWYLAFSSTNDKGESVKSDEISITIA